MAGEHRVGSEPEFLNKIHLGDCIEVMNRMPEKSGVS
jgi:hypothetical protein